jgi:hypothetical protein
MGSDAGEPQETEKPGEPQKKRKGRESDRKGKSPDNTAVVTQILQHPKPPGMNRDSGEPQEAESARTVLVRGARKRGASERAKVLDLEVIHGPR